eukprot:TRINITY_DN1392_c0_g1_i5.p1 TRINITY_DN1392_c0_g1~~TRINITY_DN1392_c0_g1_i5.p1  ORF type:complete len:338 (+),score=136.58 TRINITY_DN1392_c0_g1_i5:65-1015(+)
MPAALQKTAKDEMVARPRSAEESSCGVTEEALSTGRRGSTEERVTPSRTLMARVLGGVTPAAEFPEMDDRMAERMADPMWDLLPGWLKPMVAHLIERCSRSTKDPSMTPENHTQCDFECVQVPGVSVEYYCAVLFNSYPSMLMWLRAFSVMDCFLESTGSDLNKYTVHRLLVTCLHTTAQYLGEDVPLAEVHEYWGVTAEDLVLMGALLREEVADDFSVTVEKCLKLLLPYRSASCASVLAVQLVLSETAPARSRKEKIRSWVAGCEVPAPPLHETSQPQLGEVSAEDDYGPVKKVTSLSSSLKGYVSSLRAKLRN